MSNDGDIVARSSPQGSSIAGLFFDIGHDCTFWDRAQRKHVADGQRRVLACVDKLTGVHSLVCDEGFGRELESVRVAEDNLGQRGAAAWVVNDFLNDTADVTMAFGVVEGTECRCSFVESGVGRFLDVSGCPW
jgi:hypothetical protein